VNFHRECDAIAVLLNLNHESLKGTMNRNARTDPLRKNIGWIVSS
jgi:hypothetical protein